MSPQSCIFRAPVRRTRQAVVAAMCALALGGPGSTAARGQWDQLHKLTADDGAALDHFGVSVAIKGDVAIVGARFDDDAGSSSGSAYLFDVVAGHQLYKLIADDADGRDLFGHSVGIANAIAIVGARNDTHDAGILSGSAYLFDVTTGRQLHKLTATDAEAFDVFGVSVAISERVALVGANSESLRGAAYIFDVTTGEQLFKFTADDAAEFDRFGESVSISGDNALIGANSDDDAGERSGSAYLFDVSAGMQIFKLTAEDAAADDWFGTSVSINGDFAVVGAPRDDDACAGDSDCNSGSAYVFDVTTGEQLYKLTADDAARKDVFGISVAVGDEFVLIGASNEDGACPEDPGCDSGAVYLFDLETGAQIQKLKAADAASGHGFGFSVSTSRNRIMVGAILGDDECPDTPDCYSGSAYVFALGDPCDDEDGDGLVTICHIPPGNPENAHTITVGVGAVPAHLAHGDHCGPCDGDGLLMSGQQVGPDPPYISIPPLSPRSLR